LTSRSSAPSFLSSAYCFGSGRSDLHTPEGGIYDRPELSDAGGVSVAGVHLDREQRRALEMLADAGLRGCTGATLVGRGFNVEKIGLSASGSAAYPPMASVLDRRLPRQSRANSNDLSRQLTLPSPAGCRCAARKSCQPRASGIEFGREWIEPRARMELGLCRSESRTGYHDGIGTACVSWLFLSRCHRHSGFGRKA
jgi:hypothetical protein